jgi:hypothetical protein
LHPITAVIKFNNIVISSETELAFYRGSNRRTTRSSTSKHQHTLHQKIVDCIFVKGFPSNELAKSACSH